MVCEAGGCGAQRIAIAVVVGIDDDDRLLGSHLDHEPSRLLLLLGGQAEFRRGVGPDRAIDMEPGVEHAHLDQSVEPLLGQQIHVGLAQTGADAGEDFGVEAVLEALHACG